MQIINNFPQSSLLFSLYLNPSIYHTIWYQSQVPTMDTRGKSNAEFRNDVNETLAKHESHFDQLQNSIDQLHASMQTIITELHALHLPRHQGPPQPHPHPPDTNPFAMGETPNANRDHVHQHLKLSFSKFRGDDPTCWIYKAEQYFEFNNVPHDQRVQLASFHLEDIALQ